MKRFLLIPLLIFSVFVMANEAETIIESYDDSEIIAEMAEDSVADPYAEFEVMKYDTVIYGQDTIIVHVHPEPLYVPEMPNIHKAPMATCTKDTVITTDSLGNIIEQIEYHYQYSKDAGITTWKYSNGVVQASSTKTIKAYDEAKREILNESYKWSTAQKDWYCTTRTETTYNSAGKSTDIKKYTGGTADGNWSSSSNYYHYEFDAKGNKTLSLYHTWNTSTKSWKEVNKYEYTYNEFDWWITEYYWQKSGDNWVGISATIIDYDSNGHALNQENYGSWADGVWIGAAATSSSYPKITKVYDSNGKVTQEIDYIWSSGWEESKKIESTYSGSTLIDEAIFKKSGDQWVGTSRNSYTYDGSNMTSQTKWTWDNGTSDWIEASQDTYAYAYSGKVSEQISKIRIGGALVNKEKIENQYNDKKSVTQTNYWRWKGDTWVDSLQTRHHYNASNVDTLLVNAKWETDKWVPTDSTISIKKYEKINGTNKLVYDEKSSWSSATNKWSGELLYTYAYDANGNKILYDFYSYASGEWYPVQHEEYSYKNMNASYKTLELVYTSWNKTTKKWVAGSKNEFVFDDSNRKVITAKYSWDSSLQDWKGTSKTEDVYTGSTKTAAITYQWITSAWDWAGKSKTEYVYEGSLQMQQLTYNYNTTSNSWVNATRIDYHYNGSTRYRTDNYTWTGSAWCHTSHTENLKEGSLARADYKSSWSNCVRTSLNTTYYHYDCDPANRVVTFKNWDQTKLTAVIAIEGSTPKYPKEMSTPTKAGNAQYTYNFVGWGDGIVAVTKDTTYIAKFEQTVHKYIITFRNEDESVIEAKEWEYGATPTCTEPTKEGTAEYSYTFAGWDKTPVAVTGDATYKATFNSTKNKYTITWLNDDNTQIDQTTVEYGVVPTHDDATKAATAEYTYTFAGWDKTPVAVTGDATYKATFNSTKNKYTITWLNDDNTQIDQTTVEYGVVPTHDDATKAATAEYTYTFAGWDKTPVAVTGDATYKATFSSTKNKYTITWLNDDNTQIDQTTVEYGVVPTHDDATKAATAEYTYTFAGWDKTPVAVTGDATYKATFNSTKNKYTITWLNDDNTQIDQTTVEYGVVPTHDDATKAATAEYTYTFAGWDKTPVAVTGDATYKATFNSTKNKYTITWLNDDNTQIDQTTVEYGVVPTHDDATKAATAEYTYTFAGWDKTPVAVTGDATYKATFSSTKNKYTITWLNDDNTQIDQTTVEYGVVPTHDDATKAATAEYTYTFAGWDKTPVAVTGDATYKATFNSTKNKYTITWLNDDNTQIDQTTVEYGVVPTHDDATKAATAEYTYTFAGWDKTPVAVTGDATYKATFSSTKNKYTITWLNDDNTQIDQTTVEYGVVPTHDDATKAATAEYTYTFAGWDKTPVAVTGDATYKATFSSTKNKYTITWLNDDNTQIDQTTVEYGVVPTHDDATKAATAEYTYTFAGWDKTPVAVTGDATYKATFSSTKNKYTITWLNDDNTQIDQTTVEYGVVPTHDDATKAATAEYTYTFNGWTPEIVAVTGDATYKATYTSTINTYDITFEVKDDPTKSYTIPSVPYGTMLSTLIEQVKTALGGDSFEDNEYIYTFVGIEDAELTDIVTSSKTYYILYSKKEKTGTAIDGIQSAVSVQKVIRNDQVIIIREGKAYTSQGVLLQ